MITIDTTSKKVIYNPQYFVAKHFSYYVKANAKKIKSSGNFTDQVAFRNPDGAIVVVLSNSSPSAASVGITFGSSMINVTLPKTSFSTAVIYDSIANDVIFDYNARAGRHALVKVTKTGNNIVLTPSDPASFAIQVLGIDGSLKASFSSAKGPTCTIKADEMPSGMYVLKGLVHGKRYFSTIPIVNR
jgi:hypothetical protein